MSSDFAYSARWIVAWALAAWAAGCSPRTQQVGEVAACAAPFCDAGGSDADAELPLPIGPPVYADHDPRAFARTAEDMLGVWSGITVTLEQISAPFELRFEPGDVLGEGRYTGTCVEELGCVPFGQYTSLHEFEGRYRLLYVDDAGVGEGDLAWQVSLAGSGVSASWKMRNLLLRDMGQVLYFVLDSPAGGISVVLTRGPYNVSDAGVGADAGDASGRDAGIDPDAAREAAVDAEASAEDGRTAP